MRSKHPWRKSTRWLLSCVAQHPIPTKRQQLVWVLLYCRTPITAAQPTAPASPTTGHRSVRRNERRPQSLTTRPPLHATIASPAIQTKRPTQIATCPKLQHAQPLPHDRPQRQDLFPLLPRLRLQSNERARWVARPSQHRRARHSVAHFRTLKLPANALNSRRCRPESWSTRTTTARTPARHHHHVTRPAGRTGDEQ